MLGRQSTIGSDRELKRRFRNDERRIRSEEYG
jgi:hypothetical protein